MSTYHLVVTNIAMERSTIFKFGKPSINAKEPSVMALAIYYIVISGYFYGIKTFYKWGFLSIYL